MTVVAKVVSLHPDATYALVDGAQQVSFLQEECRIYGSPEGVVTASAPPSRLRLALEEMAVGVAKGFLRLETATIEFDGNAIDDDEKRILVEEITRELTGTRNSVDAIVDVAWKVCKAHVFHGTSDSCLWSNWLTAAPQRRDRLRIFRDLWERGYTVTFGSKFGADFLVYRDNPKTSHAVALVVVKEYEEEFARVDVVSFCRVAKMVKKQLLLASVRKSNSEDEQKGDADNCEAAEVHEGNVVYVSLTHALLVSHQEESG